MTALAALQIAATFIWLGMVLGISFLEAPLKFRAPGITVPLAVGIGRIVFRALNIAETALAVVIIVCMVVRRTAGGSDVPSAVEWVTCVVVVLALAIGALVLRRRMDRRVVAGVISAGALRNVAHVGYVALELLKVFGLLALGGATLCS